MKSEGYTARTGQGRALRFNKKQGSPRGNPFRRSFRCQTWFLGCAGVLCFVLIRCWPGFLSSPKGHRIKHSTVSHTTLFYCVFPLEKKTNKLGQPPRQRCQQVSKTSINITMDTQGLPPLGEGLPPHNSLEQIQHEPPPPLSSIPGRARQHLVPLKADVVPSASTAGERGRDSSFSSPPPSPPRLGSCSPVPSRGVPKMGSMDDSYCDRIRSTR